MIGDKAFALYENSKVRRLPKARVYGIEDGDFIVTLAGYQRLCTCPNPQRCSHVEAAEMMLADEKQREALDTCEVCELRPVDHVDQYHRLCDSCAETLWSKQQEANQT